MSLLDQVRNFPQQVIDRLKELEPLAREYEQLRKFAERLGLKYTPDADAEVEAPQPRAGATRRSGRAAKARATPRAARSTSRQRAARSTKATAAGPASASARTRAAAGTSAQRSGGRRAGAARPGQRGDDVLRLVAESPGITVREIAERLGIESAGVYRVVKRLTDDGRVRKDGAGLHPVESAPAPQATADTEPETAPGNQADVPQASAPAEPQASPSSTDSASSADT